MSQTYQSERNDIGTKKTGGQKHRELKNTGAEKYRGLESHSMNGSPGLFLGHP